MAGKKNTITVLVFSILMLFAVHVFNTEARAEEWLAEINPNARMKALGSAGVALSDNLSLLYVNPGSMSHNPYGRLSLFYGNLSEGSHFTYLEYVYPFTASGSLGAGIEARIKDSSNYIQNYYFGFSFSLLKALSVGIAAESIIKKLSDDTAKAITLNAGFHIAMFKWLNLGITGENLLAPELEYSQSKTIETTSRKIKAGLNIYHADYFSFVADIYAQGFDSTEADLDITDSYGLEIRPDPALALRTGVTGGHMRFGFGLVSKNMDFDYAIVTEYDNIAHFFNIAYKFGMSPSRREIAVIEKEKALLQKEAELGKDGLYNEGLVLLNMGEAAAAMEKAEEYRETYGTDDRVEDLKREIDRWLNNVRKEKLGRAEDLKKDILVEFYHGRLDQARIKLANLKLLAPKYEDAYYLEYLLNASNLLEKGEYTQAEEELVNALKINPDSIEVRDLYNRLKEVMKLSE
ncbi:MAG: hypothetical protein ABIH89_00635 [Elusimicrobiota bacterium]